VLDPNNLLAPQLKLNQLKLRREKFEILLSSVLYKKLNTLAKLKKVAKLKIIR